MFSNNTFSNPANRTNTSKTTIWLMVICLLFSAIIGFTIAFFYEDDFATNNIGTSGPVNIEAIGVGDLSIEDAYTCNLVVSLDDEYETLVPGMPIDLTANCKVYQSSTKPLLRAMISLDLIDMELGEEFDENSNLEMSRIMVVQNILNQLRNEVEDNGWYLHTDSYYYYIGSGKIPQGGGTVIEEIDVVENNQIIHFINNSITFPTNVTSTYSGLGVKFVISFQAIQNYIPDAQGNKLDNTIENSYKIFDYFEQMKLEPTPLSYFSISNGTLSIASGVTLPENLVLPSTDAEGNPITSISDNFLKGNTTVKSVVIPTGYTSIGIAAFNQSKVESVDMSQSSVTTISRHCFSDCSSLTSIKLNEGLVTLSSFSFNNCSSLRSIVLPESLQIIQQYAFMSNQFYALHIPKNVSNIQDYVFQSTKFLMKVTVDKENQYYYDVDNIMLCDYAGKLLKLVSGYAEVNLDIPEGIKHIFNFSLRENSNVEILNISSTVEQISDWPRNCKSFSVSENNQYIVSPTGYELIYTSDGSLFKFKKGNLEEYAIPDECRIINSDVFSGCVFGTLIVGRNVSSVNVNSFSGVRINNIYVNANNMYMYVDQGVALISNDGIFCKYASLATLSEYTVPLGVTIIGHSAFLYNTNLVKLIMQTGVVEICSIDGNSFTPELKYVKFPSTLTSLGVRGPFMNYAIRNGVIVFEGTTPPSATWLKHQYGGATIYVPDEALEAYKTASAFSEVADYIYPISQYVEG